MAFSLKDYEIVAEIGQGGFASVYRARQKSLPREVAIKRLSPQRMQNTTEILRFRREAEAMAALTHDNIVAVFDYAFHDGSYYIVMEYVDGMTLEAALEKRLPRESALFALEKAAAALVIAHEQNIIHRDIKPANILLGKNGQVKLADFGLALFRTGMESFSAPGSVLGTISYMAPEALVSPKDVDFRIDVFSLGCIIYQVIAGRHPFAGADFGEISQRLLNEIPSPLPASSPALLAAMTMRCLEKDREKRPSMTELHEALQTSVRGVYHEAQTRLTAFVRQGIPGTHSAELPEAPEAEEQRAPSSRIGIIAGTVLLAAVAAAVFFLYTPFKPGPTSSTSLPVLPILDTLPAAVEAPYDSRHQGAKKNMITDGPAPMTQSSIDMKTGTLVLEGLAESDSAFLDHKPVAVHIQDTEAHESRGARIKLVPGHYQLDIRRNGAPFIRRELELVPFERRIIDLRKETR
jgi:serine/threonine protein kinase